VRRCPWSRTFRHTVCPVGGTPSPGPGHLTDRPAVPGDGGDEPKATPGTYAADDAQRERGKAVKPGN